MSGTLFSLPRYIPVSSTGRPYPLATLTFYEAGTTTLATVYTTSALSVASANPLTANSAGMFAAVYLDPNIGYNYKVVLKNSSGSTLWTEDNIIVGTQTYPRTAREIANGITPTNYAYPPGNVRRYGGTCDGAADDTAELQAAFDSGEPVDTDGTCAITASIVANPTGNLYVTGKVTSTVTDAGTYGACIEINAATTSQIKFDNFQLTHSGTGATLYGINIPDIVAQARFDNVRVSGARYYGVSCNATQQTHTNCRYYDNVHGGAEVFGGSINLVGTDCINNGNGTDNTTGYGVVISGTDSRVVGGRFADNDRYGIDGRYSDNLTVDGAYVYNAGYVGIYAVNEDATKDAKNTKIVNCTVDMNSRANSLHCIWAGAYASGSTVSVGEVLIKGNTLKGAVDKGILVGTGDATYGPESIIITDNSLSACAGQYGLFVDGTKAPRCVIVSKNELRTAGEINLCATTAGTNVVVTDNVVTWAGTYTRAIYVKAVTAIVTGNMWSGTLSSGTGFDYVCTSLTFDNNQSAYYKGSATFDPASLADGAGETTTVTVTGAELGDYAQASFSLNTSGITITAWVSAANTVSVRFQNESGGVLDIGSGTLRAVVTKVK